MGHNNLSMGQHAAQRVDHKINSVPGLAAGVAASETGAAVKGKKIKSFLAGGTARLDAARAAAVSRLKESVLKKLGLGKQDIERVLLELQKRHIGENAPHHTKFGTFIEIACAILPDVMKFRRDAIDSHIRTAIFSAVMEIECHIGRTAKVTELLTLKLEDFAIRPGATKPKSPIVPVREKFPTDKAYDKAWGSFQKQAEDFVEEYMKVIDRAAIVHFSDTKIAANNGAKKYVDRVAMLRLTDGRHLFLLSEEYKGRRSGGGEAQSAIRMDRILNDMSVEDTTKLTGRIDDPDELANAVRGLPGSSQIASPTRTEAVEVKDILFNMMSFTQDQILVKASKLKGDARYTQVQRTKGYIQRKSTYGQTFRRGRDANEGLYKYNPEFPSREIHTLIRKLEAAN